MWTEQKENLLISFLYYSCTLVIWSPVIRISLLSGCNLAVYTIFHSFPYKILLKTKTKWMNFSFFSFYRSMNHNLFQPVAMSKYIITYILLNLLCLSITPISGQITYPDRCQSRRGQITKVGAVLYFFLFLFFSFLLLLSRVYIHSRILHLFWWNTALFEKEKEKEML